jgi:hypothetical protein
MLSGALNLTREGVMKRNQLSEERIAFALRQAESGTAARSAKVLLKPAKASLSSVRTPRRPHIASAGFQFVGKFREQFSLRDTEYASGSSLLDCKSQRYPTPPLALGVI